MAFGSKETELKLAKAEAQIEMYEKLLIDKDEEISELKTMLIKTQDALIAKEAPRAYSDQKIAEWESQELSPEEEEERRKIKLRAETNANYLADIEKPLFKDATEMIDVLSRTQNGTTSVTAGTSIHGDGES